MNRYEKFLDVLVKGYKENMAPSMVQIYILFSN